MMTKNYINQYAIWLFILIAMVCSLTIGPLQVEAIPRSDIRVQNSTGLYQLVCAATECNGGSRICSIVRVPSNTPGMDYIYPCFELTLPADDLRL